MLLNAVNGRFLIRCGVRKNMAQSVEISRADSRHRRHYSSPLKALSIADDNRSSSFACVSARWESADNIFSLNCMKRV